MDGPGTGGEGDEEDSEGARLMPGNTAGDVQLEDNENTDRRVQGYQDEFIPSFEPVKTLQQVATVQNVLL